MSPLSIWARRAQDFQISSQEWNVHSWREKIKAKKKADRERRENDGRIGGKLKRTKRKERMKEKAHLLCKTSLHSNSWQRRPLICLKKERKKKRKVWDKLTDFRRVFWPSNCLSVRLSPTCQTYACYLVMSQREACCVFWPSFWGVIID